jgi:hypothetical protein
VRGCALGIATRVTGAVFGDGRGRCSLRRRVHGARAHRAVREDQETNGRKMRASRTFQRAGSTIERPGSVNIESTVSARRTRSARCGGHLNIAQIMRGQRPPRPQARTVGGVRAHEPRSITRSRVFRWLLLTRPTAHNLCVMFWVPAQSPLPGGWGALQRRGRRCSSFRNQHHSAISSRSSSCASVSKAASSASALVGSDGSSTVPGTIERARRTFPGCVAVWISFKRRIETWV